VSSLPVYDRPYRIVPLVPGYRRAGAAWTTSRSAPRARRGSPGSVTPRDQVRELLIKNPSPELSAAEKKTRLTISRQVV